jgi:hypothetical protein
MFTTFSLFREQVKKQLSRKLCSFGNTRLLPRPPRRVASPKLQRPPAVMSINLRLNDRLPALAAAAALVSSATLMYRALRFPDSPRERSSSSFATASKTSPHWGIYPEDFYPGGAYVDLPHGRTRYWLLGPEDGTRVRVVLPPVATRPNTSTQVVLVSGLTIPAYIWDKVARGLADSGCHVMVYGACSEMDRSTWNSHYYQTSAGVDTPTLQKTSYTIKPYM